MPIAWLASRAVSLLEAANTIDQTRGDKRNVAIGLGNLAHLQIPLGDLAGAERNLRRRVELFREIEDEFREAVGNQELGRLLAYQGMSKEAEVELTQAQGVFDQRQGTNFISVVRAYLSLHALLMWRFKRRACVRSQGA